ncbi:GDSL-type esterase/lipase family protein [Austwickia sp. TVS 96-490-7B]|uniref:GDSL-type esterase/lipase family protein n=1 Tax=Austwickia sp. TVS 96-490-7B TaxID=2830843 RepID=UPI001C55E679|nr:GDSL-type esterase/lipase family protein [Austwickia sp. TVS 96-490-7B]
MGSDDQQPPMEFIASAEALAMDGPRDVGLVFVGDSFVAGYGDPKALGWVSRVVARTTHPDLDLTPYNLGVRGQSSADLLTRWRAEGLPRWAERRERRLVIGVGQGDLDQDLTIARARLNMANMLDDATARGISPFVVGPPPTLDQEFNSRLESLVEAQSDVCARRSIPYVDCYYPLLEHDQWLSELSAATDQRHPGQAGYGLLAWLVLHGGWEHWLAIAP